MPNTSDPTFTQDTMILLHSSLKADRLHARHFNFLFFFFTFSHTEILIKTSNFKAKCQKMLKRQSMTHLLKAWLL